MGEVYRMSSLWIYSLPKACAAEGNVAAGGGSENTLLELERLGHSSRPLWPPCSITSMVVPLLTLLHFTV